MNNDLELYTMPKIVESTMLRVYLKRQKVVKQKTVKKFIEELRPLQAEKPLLSIGERGNKYSILADGFAVIHENTVTFFLLF